MIQHDFRLFRLTAGRYVEVEVGAEGFWFSELQLSLGKWSGRYMGVDTQWLRWFDQFHELIPTEQERAKQAEQRAQQAEQQVQQAGQRAERLAAQLRALGIEPE